MIVKEYNLKTKIETERELTAEEIAAMEAATEQPEIEQHAELTTEERLANLEEALNMILNGVTE